MRGALPDALDARRPARADTAVQRVAARVPLAAAVALTLALAPAAGARTIVVDAFDDGRDAAPGDGICASDDVGVEGRCTLRSAVTEANASPGPDAIALAVGTYRLTLGSPFEGPDDLAEDIGDLDATEELRITGAGADHSTVDANGIDRVLHVAPGVPVSLAGVTLRGGDAGAGRGGGVLVLGSLTLGTARVVASRASEGGGIAIAPGGRAELALATVEGNVARAGGGIWSAGTLSLRASIVRGNTATAGAGGGLLSSPSAALPAAADIAGTAVDGNGASRGAGVASLGGSLLLANVTIARNTAAEAGGGLLVAGPADLRHVTIAANAAPTGAALAVEAAGDVAASNALLVGPAGSTCSGAGVARGDHDLASDTSCGLGRDGDQVGVDPMLGPLAGNGGAVPTMALRAGSPAIDGGAAASCSPTDARLVPRPLGAGCDLGAVESPWTRGLPVPAALRACTVIGTDAADRLVGTGGPDVLCGLRGDDRLDGLEGPDRLDGGPGADDLIGGPGDDRLLAGPGDDRLRGGAGRDRLDGGPGLDRIARQLGDVLVGAPDRPRRSR
ncbi:MAG: choice-of-anchor Q domain-containing protein [Thermoleophilia bacterium]